MAQRERGTFPPVTLGHIRSQGCRDILSYCGSIMGAFNFSLLDPVQNGERAYFVGRKDEKSCW
jgi:hypothetical protein